MAQEFGIRVTSLGPNRLRVIALVRPYLWLSPKQALALASSGNPILLGEQFSWPNAWPLRDELNDLGASVEMFVTSGCDH